MSLVAAAVVPAAPALLPGLGGLADPLAGLRQDAAEAVATVVSAHPGARVVIVTGVAGVEGGWCEWPLAAPSGAARFTDGRVPEGALPTGLEVGRLLLGDLPDEGDPPRLVGVAADAPPEPCDRLGAELVDGAPTVLVAVADGSATRTVKAPGHLDERAEAFDAELSRALAEVDGPALAATDPGLADALWCRGRAALQVLGGAARSAGPALRGEVRRDEAPFGVGYLVATWR